MDTRKVLLGWIIYVAGTTAIYALLFNGKFGHSGQLPVWLIGAVSVMAIAAIVILVQWLRGVKTGWVTKDRARDVSGFFWMIMVTGAVGDMLAVAAEIAFGASAVWLMIPIATITYALCVVWLYHRYFKSDAPERSKEG